MIAPAIPLPFALLLWHGSILWGSGWFPSLEICEEAKIILTEQPSMITDAECVKP